VSQRRALGVLFGLISVALAGVAFAAWGDAWPVTFAAAVLALWMASMALRGLRR
jgi:hypothetical protein